MASDFFTLQTLTMFSQKINTASREIPQTHASQHAQIRSDTESFTKMLGTFNCLPNYQHKNTSIIRETKYHFVLITAVHFGLQFSNSII